jgi:hypothetical protein
MLQTRDPWPTASKSAPDTRLLISNDSRWPVRDPRNADHNGRNPSAADAQTGHAEDCSWAVRESPRSTDNDSCRTPASSHSRPELLLAASYS